MKTWEAVAMRWVARAASLRPAGDAAVRVSGVMGPVVFALLLLVSAPLQAQETDLPSAEEIIDRSIEVMGGRAAFERLYNNKSTGTMEMPQMGLKASTISYSAAPAKMYVAMESEGLGTMESGGDGEVYWERTMMTGPKVKKGEEKAVARREAMFHGNLKWRELYPEVETTAIDTVDGKPCYRILLTPVDGQPETHCYDVESGLLVKSEMKVKTDMGVIPVETYLSDYREAEGVLSPHHVRQVIMGIQEMLFTTDSLWYNVEIPDSVFALPPNVAALLAKQEMSGESAVAPESGSAGEAGKSAESDAAPAEEPAEPIEVQ